MTLSNAGLFFERFSERSGALRADDAAWEEIEVERAIEGGVVRDLCREPSHGAYHKVVKASGITAALPAQDRNRAKTSTSTRDR